MHEYQLEISNELTMKLLHYFVTKEGYNPVVLRGAKNEIWLEKVDSEYKFIRIASSEIRNQEQFELDLNRTNRIRMRLGFKTFSIKSKLLNIYTNIDKQIKIESTKLIDTISPISHDKFSKNKKVTKQFGNLDKKLDYKEKGKELFMKITHEINETNQQNLKINSEVFKQRKPYITYTIIAINILVFLAMELFHLGSTTFVTLIDFGALYTPLVRGGDYYRLLSSVFIHIGLIHLIFNSYALYVVGRYVESYFGHIKFLIIYLFSGFLGSLLSIVFNTGVSAGASGAIFGLLGAILYFGYHYRVFLRNFLKNQIIPVIILNLALGFLISGINNAAHIGGLIGGVLISMAVGIKYKTKIFEKINAYAAIIVIISFLTYLGFFYNDVYRDIEFDNSIITYYELTDQEEKTINYKEKVSKYD